MIGDMKYTPPQPLRPGETADRSGSLTDCRILPPDEDDYMSTEAATTEVSFTVWGKPAQMGSKKAFVVGKRAILTDDNSKARKSWANAVASAAAEAMEGGDLFDGPVALVVTFWFARPKSHYGTGRNSGVLKNSAPKHHSQSPDCDKLLRCLGDALTGTVIRDDRQICEIAAKRLWTEKQEGAIVTIIQKDQV